MDPQKQPNFDNWTDSEPPHNDPKHPVIMIFKPTMEEFKDFMNYVAFMESRGAHLGGIAKIVPPREWKPRKNGYGDLDNKIIEAPIKQGVAQAGTRGAYEVRNTEQPTMTLGQLRNWADDKNLLFHFSEDDDEMERNFWKQLSLNPPVYGADNSGSLFDDDVEEWNISRLPSVLDAIQEEYGIRIQGVNTPYLYYGMWRAFFGWHTEDMDLYSINYIHDGASKFWYSISPSNGRRFERMAEAIFAPMHKRCHAFLRHKTTLISPTVLRSQGVPFNKIQQHCGEIIITFPFAYHAGFNTGLNVAESTNFATPRWIEYGKYASICACQSDNVRIEMSIFIKKFQPDRLEAWENGTERGRHPEDDRPNGACRPPTSGPCALVSSSGRKGKGRPKAISTPASSPPDLIDHDYESRSSPTKRARSCSSEADSTLSSANSSSPEVTKSHYGGRMRAFTVKEPGKSKVSATSCSRRMIKPDTLSPTKHDHNYYTEPPLLYDSDDFDDCKAGQPLRAPKHKKKASPDNGVPVPRSPSKLPSGKLKPLKNSRISPEIRAAVVIAENPCPSPHVTKSDALHCPADFKVGKYEVTMEDCEALPLDLSVKKSEKKATTPPARTYPSEPPVSRGIAEMVKLRGSELRMSSLNTPSNGSHRKTSPSRSKIKAKPDSRPLLASGSMKS